MPKSDAVSGMNKHVKLHIPQFYLFASKYKATNNGKSFSLLSLTTICCMYIIMKPFYSMVEVKLFFLVAQQDWKMPMFISMSQTLKQLVYGLRIILRSYQVVGNTCGVEW